MNRLLFLAVVVGLFSCQLVNEANGIAVMSVDFGNEFTKVAIVKPGVPMEIVLNKESSRKTPSVVFISDDERLYADAANSKGARKPAQRYAYLLDVIGKNLSHPSVQQFKEAYPFYDLIEDSVTGTVVFQVKSGDEVKQFRPEELLGMILEYSRKNVEDFSEQKVKSGIITVPVHFGQLERQAMIRASLLAGIEPLQLINDNAATALQYGLVKLSTFSDTPQYFVIFDLGSTHTTATVVSFEKMKAKDDGELVEHVIVRGVATTRDLSTTIIHRAIRDHLLHQFETNQKNKNIPSFRNDHKALAKLFKESARVVHILSANQAVQSYVEGIVGDHDFQGHMTRAELEDACDKIFHLIPSLIQEALKRANLGADAISEIVLMGAGTRIPKVQEILKKSLEGRELTDLGRGLNTDEAAALGSVYQAAHLSKGFKVKRIVLRDAVNYPVSVEFDRVIDANSTKKDQEAGVVKRMLFDMSSPFPQKKLITFGKHSSDFSFNVSFAGNIDPTWLVQVSGVSEAFAKHADKQTKGIKAHFAMDDSGILHIRMMEAIFEAEENETVVEEKGIFSKFGDKLKGFFSSEENSTASNSTDTNADGTPTPTEAVNSTEAENSTATAAPSGNTVVKTKTVTYRENLTFAIEYLGAKAFPEEEMTKSKALLKEFRKKDEARLQLAKAKNDLEAAVIEVKDRLENEDAKQFIKPEDLEAVAAKVKAVGDWLDEEAGPFTPLSELTDQLSQLRTTILPWYERMRQAVELPKAIDQIKQTLNTSELLLSTFRQLQANITSANPEDSLFSEVELETLERQINETYSWLEMMLEAQKAVAKHEDPKMKIEDVKEKGAILEREVRYLTNKAKAYRPKPKPKPKKEKKENESIIIDDTTSVPPESPDSQQSPVNEETPNPDNESAPKEEDAKPSSTTEKPTTSNAEEDDKATHSPTDL